jgi:hypothetical protein
MEMKSQLAVAELPEQILQKKIVQPIAKLDAGKCRGSLSVLSDCRDAGSLVDAVGLVQMANA